LASNDVPLVVKPPGPLDRLRWSLKRNAPQVRASFVKLGDAPLMAHPGPHLRVSYRDSAPYLIVWCEDLGVYEWRSGPQDGRCLSPNPDVAAQLVAEVLALIIHGRARLTAEA
jgi:hypothetical protein